MANQKKNVKKVNNEKKEVITENKQEIVKQDMTIALLVIICLLLVVILVIIIKGHEAKLKDGKEVIASIEGKDITSEDLFDELKRQYGTNALINQIDDFIASKEIKDSDEAKKEANARIESLKQQYVSLGYDFNVILANNGYESEDELRNQFISDYKREKIAKNYLSDHLTEDEINAYYENEIHGKLTVKHILVKPDVASTATADEKTAAEEAAKARAQEVIQKLNEGVAWADLVNEYSDDTGSKAEEGLIADFDQDGVVSEFFQASLKLADNEYTKEPVKSTYGYHVILRISQAEKPTLDSVKEKIKTNLVNNKIATDNKLLDKTWTEIRKDYKMKINDTKLEKIYNSIIKQFE